MTDIDEKAVAEAVGKAIARRRSNSGLTQEQVAETLGVGNEAVSRMERGIVIPNVVRLYQIAAALGCEASELLSEASPHTDDQGRRISALLQQLDEADRHLVIGIVEQLAARLRAAR
ncbi:helix-turn-helix domain-containing protein [Pseudomonas typographi]|uniref:Helix-turn-helix transcriptional regulator n=1 Tax=Pseudomonas typographi TaxID=2715964 RepID=A0ABR7Z373_9PSED|nr:helix-turn-helix transcriptional regulator [Pseudomonas typographi]